MKRKEEMHQAEVDRLQEELARSTTLFDVQKKDLELVMQEKVTAEKQCDELKNAMSKRA